MTTETGTRPVNGYESFFGFTELPFSLSVNTRFRFSSASHEAALSQVAYALERREPVVVVTGDIGMGKTLLCRTVVDRLPRKTFLSVINDPLLGRDDLLKRILHDFGVISTENGAGTEISRHDLAHALEKFLASLGQLKAHAAVIVDEAQHVRPEVLEQIRLLANIHDEEGTLLQIVLVGQPDLQTVLAGPELQPLRQRVSRIIQLNALTSDEVKSYIVHRLVVARQTPTDSPIPGAHDLVRAIAEWNESSGPATFTDDAIDVVSRLSNGVPRLVNLLCDRALEAAYARQSRTVSAPDVSTAAGLLQLRDVAAASVTHREPKATSHVRKYAAAAAAAALVGAVIWFGGRMRAQGRHLERRPEAAVATPENPSRSIAQPVPEPVPPPAAATSRPIGPGVEGAATVRAQAAGGETTNDTSGDRFEIVVASFRTEARATAVATQLQTLGHAVRQRATDGWQQIIIGPFASSAAADDAQRQLDRQGFTGTRVVRESR